MFYSARWKAYLRNLQSVAKDNEEGDDANDHHKVAKEHLKRCDELLEECNTIVDALEETLANTPKPSEVLDWRSI